jgi:hypothetical protein
MKPRLLLLFSFATPAWGGDHVRVILDTSQSMRTNDPPRLAALSAALLYDLANPNISTGDSFEVLAFDPSLPLGFWKSGPPPVHTGPRLPARHGGRAAFIEALRKTPYDARNTYYYPVLKMAIDDLKTTPGGTADRRAVVLVTDGMPEDPDIPLIQKDLVSQLGPSNIRLYILALGPEAAGKSHLLHEILGGPSVGDLFVDPTGENLLSHMIEIFSRSFGYTAEQPQQLTGALPLNLDGNQRPARVAVVSYWRNSKAPLINLSPPTGHGINNPEGIHTAEGTGASFAVRWVLSPGPGTFALAADSPGAMVAVLRPARLLVDIRAQPGSTIEYTIAKVPFPVRVLVRPPGGAKGDPGLVDLSFQTHGPKTSDGFTWDGNREGPPSAGVVTTDGRYFDIFPAFRPEAVESHEYTGWLTVELRRREALVGTEAARVLVYPYLRLSPAPSVVNAAINGEVRALQHRETACATFAFQLDGALPHPDRPSYSVRAAIDASMSGDPRLNRAHMTLDGTVLDYFGAPGPNPGAWYSGRTVDREALLGDHKVCFQAGRPKEADPAKPVEIPIQLKLAEAPYDTLPVALPVTLKAFLSPTGFLEQNAIWMSLALLLLATGLLAFVFRGRPDLPPGLEFAAARDGSSDRMSAVPLTPVSQALHFLGLNRNHRVAAESGSVTLGWVKPESRDLYRFRAAPGVTLLGDAQETAKQTGLLSVHRTYVARAAGASYQFRLQHR